MKVHSSKSRKRKCPSIDKWLNKMWYIEYYLALKSNKALIQAPTCMNLESFMPSEES